MLKQLDRAGLDRLLREIATDYRLQVPQHLADGTRQLAGFGDGELSLFGAVPQRKPTSYFFPQIQRLLNIDAAGGVELPEAALRPLALFGLNRADLAGLHFLDRFFLAAPADDVYLRQRSGALLIGLTGEAGADRSFLPLSAGDCDIEMVAIEQHWLALGHSTLGAKLLQGFPAGDEEQLCRLRNRGVERDGESDLLQQASLLLREDKVPDRFWAEIADRCILCSGCNLVCPTCSCFCVQDRIRGGVTERSRVWDSCQLDAFMREASGHNPLGTEVLRTRRRIHHKLVVDVERWGELGCVACGRCDRACPSGIGMLAVLQELVQRYGEELG
ncbi:4Fe-4S dicluster domain-containing protein [Geopsychrobacter electrodiphilus]|uniref:4Fe-4S dicluster domain-containing protein n=1 Tax=Geopsychrobacter electrodiphilus TaxID=225196 RepID=UPI00035F4AB1|nr:4Fe-4S dicluster domain-containing protein [Geopsychrobacter electrodiphilus]